MKRSHHFAILVALVLTAAGAAPETEAQASAHQSLPMLGSAATNLPSEAGITRARVANAIRELLRSAEGDAIRAGLKDNAEYVKVVEFVDQPFTATAAPTLEQLEKTLTAAKTLQEHAGAEGAAAGLDINKVAPTSVPSNASNTGFLPSQGALLYGLTDFMVERAKDELVFSFMLRLKTEVDDEPVVTAGMPRSWELIQKIDTETFQTLMPAVRTAFVEDLNLFPQRLGSAEFRQAMGWSETPLYVQGLAIAFSRGLEIRRGVPPAIALTNLVEVTESDLSSPGLRAVLNLVGLLAREYAVVGGEALMQELSGSDQAQLRRYFLAFMGNDAIEIGGASVVALRNSILGRLSQREADAVVLLNQLHALRTGLSAAAQGEAESAQSGDRVLALAGSVLEILGTARRFVPDQVTELTSFDQFIGDAQRLHQALTAREYGTIVTWVVQRPELKAKLDDTGVRYLSLAASLAAARTSEEVTVALQTAAAPVGSYRAKRNQYVETGPDDRTPFFARARWLPQSVSIVGYLGVGGGWEGTRDTPLFKDAHHVGVALPVGVEVSTGFPGGALSLFAPILDLGVLASARLGGPDDVGSSPEIGFEQVVAPGLFLVWNWAGAPVSLGAGIQSVPELRQRQVAGGEPQNVDVVRFGLFLGVDATLLHFRFRSRKQR